MKIGEMSKRTGCSVQTIRYYEKEGLLSACARSDGNFRLYDKEAEERLMFIKHCRNLDLSLEEVKQLLTLSQNPGAACEQVNGIVDSHINQVESRIAELESLRHHLRRLRKNCSENRTVEECGIIKTLATQ